MVKIDPSKELIALQKELTPVEFDHKAIHFFGHAIRKSLRQVEAGFQRVGYFFKTIELGGPSTFKWGKRESKQQRGFSKLPDHLERLKGNLKDLTDAIPGRYGKGPYPPNDQQTIKNFFDVDFHKFNEQVETMEKICDLIQKKSHKITSAQGEELKKVKQELTDLKAQFDDLLKFNEIVEEPPKEIKEARKEKKAGKRKAAKRPDRFELAKRQKQAVLGRAIAAGKEPSKEEEVSVKKEVHKAQAPKKPGMTPEDILKDLDELNEKNKVESKESKVAGKKPEEHNPLKKEEKLEEVPLDKKAQLTPLSESKLKNKIAKDFLKIYNKLVLKSVPGEKKDELERKLGALRNFIVLSNKNEWESEDIKFLVLKGKSHTIDILNTIYPKKPPLKIFKRINADLKEFGIEISPYIKKETG